MTRGAADVVSGYARGTEELAGGTTSARPNAARDGSARAAAMQFGFAVAVVVASLLLYRPWHDAPFASADFPEFVPLLRSQPTFGGRLGVFVDYYGAHGRFNLLQYVFIILKWQVLGANPVAWQWARALQMFGILAGTFALLRRLRLSASSAATAVALLGVSTATASGWTRLTMGEPLALLFLLGAALLAARFQLAHEWKRVSLGFAVLVAAMLLTKEMMIASLPFLLLLALLYRGAGEWGRRSYSLTAREKTLLVATALAVATAAVPIVACMTTRASGGFASHYGEGGVAPGRVAYAVARMLLPVNASQTSALRVLLFPANALIALVIGAGLTSAARCRSRSLVWPVATALSLPLAGAVVYLPWPVVANFYPLPFQVGAATLLALSLDMMRSAVPRMLPAARVMCAVATILAAAASHRMAGNAYASRHVEARLSDWLAGNVRPGQRVLRAVPSDALPPPERAWMGIGSTLSRYIGAFYARPDLRVVEVSCDEASALYRGEGSVVVLYKGECPRFGTPAAAPTITFGYFDPLLLRAATDSVRAEIFRSR